MKTIFLTLILTLTSSNVSANSEGGIILGPSERSYIENTCPGKPNYRLTDGTYVDCLTDTHAIEYERSKNWYESIGQSLYYASETKKKAGIIFIEMHSEKRYLKRLSRAIEYHKLHSQIDIWCLINNKIQRC